MDNNNGRSIEAKGPVALGEILTDLRKRLGRIEKHLIDLKGNPPRKA